MKNRISTGRAFLAIAVAVALAGAAVGADPPVGENGTIQEQIVDSPAEAPPAAPGPPVPVAPAPPAAPGPSVPGPPASASHAPPGAPGPSAPVPAAAPSAPALSGQPAARPSRPAVPPAPASPQAQRPASGGGFVIKFNNADVYEVIHTLGRVAGVNYLIDPRVRGTVNVHTQGVVQKDGALELLFAILRINGATAVLEGDVYHIVPVAEAKMEPLTPQAAGGGAGAANRPVMRAFPLQYIAASEMAKVIKPFLAAGGDATEVSRANILLVTDTAANMEKHARLVELFDADAFRSAGVKLFPLKYLDPDEMSRSLDSIFGALDFGAKGGRPSGINFVPLARMNALLVVTASPKTMEDVDRWVGELDRATTATSRTVRLYRVRHGKARDLMDILERLYPGKTVTGGGKTTQFKPAVAEPVGRPPAPSPAPRPEVKPHEPPGGVSAVEGAAFDIILDEPMNALIIRGSASETAAILDTLKTIDVYPRQVLLEVLIAEVQLDDGLKLGIDWTYTRTVGSVGHEASNTTAAAALTSGLKYVVDKTDRLTAALRSLATDGKVSVLSSPSVISTNGKKSKIDVSDSVPIVTGKVTNPGTNPFVTESVEYRDVGILLTFTPFINDEGIVTLEIEQEVSEVSEKSVGSSTNPTFFKRSVNTTLIATQDRSIVLGGLVKERRSLTRDGIPFLYKIPLIGWIFGSRSSTVSRTELLIFITPRVIASVGEGTQLSREFENRVEEIKGRIGEAKGMKHEPAKEPAKEPPTE